MARRHASLSCDRLLNMQDLTLPSSGMNSLQSRRASGVQASRAASLPWALAAPRLPSSIPAGNASAQTNRIVDIVCSSNSNFGWVLSVLGAIFGFSNKGSSNKPHLAPMIGP
jgi:hypothetical protein